MTVTEWQWELVQWIDGISAVICLIILLMTWYNIKILETTFSTKYIGYFGCFGLLCFSLSAIFKTYREILYDTPNTSKTSEIFASAMYSLNWCFGQCFTYLLFIERLKYSFKGTKYELSKRYFYPFYVGIALFIIISVTAQIIWILYKQDIIPFMFYNRSGNTRNLSQCIIDWILSISLLYVFLHKLWILNMDLSVFNVNEASSVVNSRQESVIKIASRLTIISCIAIFTTQFLMIYSTITFLICYKNIECKYYNHNLKPIVEGFWGIDCFINCLCIFMSFAFENAEIMYYSLCRCCHQQCIKCCIYMTRKKMQKNQLQHQLLPISKKEDSLSHISDSFD